MPSNVFRVFWKENLLKFIQIAKRRSAVNRGSTKPILQVLAKNIFDLSIKYHIMLEVAWIPRDLNVEADSFSKTFDWDDWGVSSHIFEFFNSKWGPISCGQIC